MAEERGGNRGRKGRRRYFQPKREGSGQPQPGQPGPSGQQSNQQSNQGKGGQRPPDNKNSGQKARRARKRARSRQRYDDRTVNLEAEVAYVAPQAVYIYEHSVHPELRDTYEFRPEHFSSVGRTLDDYQLDLSKLFGGDVAADGTPVMTNLLPKPEFDWTGWEEEGRSREPEVAAPGASGPVATEFVAAELAPADPPRPESRQTESRQPEDRRPAAEPTEPPSPAEEA